MNVHRSWSAAFVSPGQPALGWIERFVSPHVRASSDEEARRARMLVFLAAVFGILGIPFTVMAHAVEGFSPLFSWCITGSPRAACGPAPTSPVGCSRRSASSSQLLDDLPEGDARRLEVAMIRDACRHGEQLVRQLLGFARRRAGEVTELHLDEVVDATVALMRRAVPKRITVEVTHAADLPALRAGGAQLVQVVLNLLVNARDAIHEVGTIRLRTDVLQLAEDDRERGLPAGAYCVLEVSDDGVGMGPDTRRRAFEPFFTTKGVLAARRVLGQLDGAADRLTLLVEEGRLDHEVVVVAGVVAGVHADVHRLASCGLRRWRHDHAVDLRPRDVGHAGGLGHPPARREGQPRDQLGRAGGGARHAVSTTCPRACPVSM